MDTDLLVTLPLGNRAFVGPVINDDRDLSPVRKAKGSANAGENFLQCAFKVAGIT